MVFPEISDKNFSKKTPARRFGKTKVKSETEDS